MLSPPNQGSEVVDALKHMAIFKWFNGPAGQQLGTDSNGIATRLGPIRSPFLSPRKALALIRGLPATSAKIPDNASGGSGMTPEGSSGIHSYSAWL